MYIPLVSQLRTDCERDPSIIIYCQSYNMCADIYIYCELTEPIDAPITILWTLASVTDSRHKELIISLFTKPSQLRVFFNSWKTITITAFEVIVCVVIIICALLCLVSIIIFFKICFICFSWLTVKHVLYLCILIF